ncbi:MAG: carboxypeptidase-like regulatory domain-containing protein [Balneolaceae bacterium]
MYNLKLLSLAITLILFVGVSCGPSGPMASEDQTAVAGVVLVEDSHDRVANATVTFEGDEMTAETNENGVFTFVGVSVGSHDVTVESDQGSANTSVEVEAGGSRIQMFVN